MSDEKKPLTVKRVLVEIFSSMATGLLVWFLAIKSTSFGTASFIITFNSILIISALILSVKLIKKNYKIFGCILITFLVPLIFIALLFGACSALL